MRLVIVVGPPRPATARPAGGGVGAALGALTSDLLARLGGDAEHPPAAAPGWERGPTVADLRVRGQEIVERLAEERGEGDGTPLVLWEDPRAASVLPFLDTVATVAATVVVLTEPDEVVRALVDAERVEAEGAAERWTRHLVNAVVDAPTPVLASAEEIHADPDAVVGRVVQLAGEAADTEELRSALRAAAMDTAERGVGRVIGGERLALARSVHALVREQRTGARPALTELRRGWQALIDADRARREAARAADALALERRARGRADERIQALERELRTAEQRWTGVARSTSAREEELEAQAQHLRRELHRLDGELDELRRRYDRLRRRRVVRTALAVADVAKPVVKKVRAYRSGEGRDGEEEQQQEAPSARVHTVVLNYRHGEDTLRCVGSLEESEVRTQHLVVVDNGSDERTLERLRAGLGPRTLLETGENLGYAAGNNVGIRYALERETDFVWILNPDTIVEPETLTRLLRTMEEEPDCGVLGGRLLNGGTDPLTIASDGGIVDRDAGGATDHRHAGERDAEVPADGPHPVDYVPGAAMLVRRRTLEDVGMLPEEFFLYFEETEFNLRVRDAGWRVLVDPRARIHHHKRSSGRLPAPYYVYYFVRNRVLFAQRHVPGWDGDVPPDLERWIDAWREKVERADPDWVPTFDELVETALADARDGVDGRREDIEQVDAGTDRG